MNGTSIVRDVTTRWLRLPLSPPIADATHVLHFLDLIVVEVRDDESSGCSYMLSFDYAPAMLKGFVDLELKRRVLGQRAAEIRAVYERLLQACEYVGQSGLAMWAVAAIDTALWDLLARRLAVPVSLLFGRYADAVPVYGSGGWLSYSEEQLSDEVGRHLARGLRAVKIKIGGASEDRDVARVKAVRQAIGPERGLMVDANQGLSVDRAIRMMRRLEDCNLRWLEEPLPRADLEGYARLATAIPVPLAAGEREFGVEPFRRLIDARAIAVAQPDLLRVGGVTGWRQVAFLAEAHRLGLAPHFYKEFDVHLAACHPNLIGIEWFDWLDPLVTDPLVIRDGLAVVPARPGFGFALQPEMVVDYEVDH